MKNTSTATWTMTPAAVRVSGRRKSAHDRIKSQSRILIESGSHTSLEKLMLFLLLSAAIIGIAYGFSCLVDLVQNWAIIERGTANLI